MPLETSVITENEPDIRAHFESQGFVIRKSDEIATEQQTAVSAAVTQAVEKAKTDLTKGFHTDLEGKIATLTGKQKPAGVKSLDWLESEFNEAKKPLETGATGSVEVDTLRANLKTTQDKLSSLESNIQTEKENASKNAISAGIKASINSLPVLGDTPEAIKNSREAMSTLVVSKFTWKFDDSGQLVPYVGDNIQVNPATQEPFTMHDLAKANFGYLLKAEVKPPLKTGGTGHQPLETRKTAAGADGVIATSKREIVEESQKRGLRGTDHTNFVKASMELSGISQ